MKCVMSDLRRALCGRWFIIAAVASAIALYMSIGNDTYTMAHMWRHAEEAEHWHFTLTRLLKKGMLGEFGVMTLPALAALPFAAQPLKDIRCGAIRPAMFRAGRGAWMLGKACACMLSGMLTQLVAVLMLEAALHAAMLLHEGRLFPSGDMAELIVPLTARMLCGGMWACAGCAIALLTGTAAAAYVAPMCLCYALTMIGARFFPGIAQLMPINWLTAGLWLPLMLMALLAAAMLLTLRREVYRYA